MKAESLITQILPAQRSRSESDKAEQAPRRDHVGKKSNFTDLLRSPVTRQAKTSVPKKVQAPSEREKASRSEEPTTRSADNGSQQTNKAQVDRRQTREQALREFRKRKDSLKTKSAEQKQDAPSEQTQSEQAQPEQSATTANPVETNSPATIDPKVGKTIKKILGSEQELIREIPALAILTGQLEHVEPKAIPVVVSSNEFLQDAFGASEINGFLETPRSIGQILSKLGIEKSDIAALGTSGIDLTALVSPTELLSTLGFDVNRLGTEIKLLKDNISMKEGLSSYITRAERLRAGRAPTNKADLDRRIEREFDDSVPSEAPQSVSSNKTQIIQPSIVTEPKALDANQTTDASAGEKLTTIETEATTTKTRQESKPRQTPPELSNNLNSLKTAAGTMEKNPQALNFETLDEAAYENFGSGINMQKIDQQTMAKNQSANLYESEPAATELKVISAQTQKPTRSITLANSGEFVRGEQVDAQNVDTPLYTSDYETSPNGQFANLDKNKATLSLIASNIAKNPSAKESIRQNTLERMTIAPLTESARIDTAGERGHTSSEQQGKDSQSQTNLLSSLSSPTGARQAKGGENPSFESMLKLDAPNQITSKVIDRARLLVKEGGGDVTLDLGTEELGKLELAMSIKNNKVDLKIVAASDQVRELLSQDIATLRESLAIQDLNLSEVEVGVNGRRGEAFDHSSSDSGNESKQNFAHQREQASRTNDSPQRPLIRRPVHHGRIQVQA